MALFWDFKSRNQAAVALINYDGLSVTYARLQELIDESISKLPPARSLVLLRAKNDLSSLVWYLACLQSNNPIILIDASLDKNLLKPLLDNYKPNLQIKGNCVEILNELNINLHDDLALLLSTSGSTGSPKLVRLSKSSVHANASSIVEYLNICESDVAITMMPMNYSYGLSVINSHLYAGAKLVITESGLLSREFWQLINQYMVTTLAGVPYMWQMLKKMRFERFDTRNIRYMTQAGGKLDPDTLNYFLERIDTKQRFIVMYGQTEATARMSYLPHNLLPKKIGSIGRAIPGGKLWIRCKDNSLTDSPNVTGEIIYHGDNVMMGYAQDQEDLALGDVNKGCLDTGDIGYCDEDGCFFVTGRAKRFIKIYGLRISLDSVDEILTTLAVDAVSTGKDDNLFVYVIDLCPADCLELSTIANLLPNNP